MALPVRDVAGSTLRSVGGLREVIQDLVTPDLKAVKVQIESLTQELRLRTESLSQDTKLRFESLQEELKLRAEGLQEEMRLRDSMQTAAFRRLEQGQAELTTAVKELTRKVDAMDSNLRERVAVLEARAPKQ